MSSWLSSKNQKAQEDYLANFMLKRLHMLQPSLLILNKTVAGTTKSITTYRVGSTCQEIQEASAVLGNMVAATFQD